MDQYLTFRLAGEEYGVGILRVREILEYVPPTRVPGVPPAIRGVINLRGNVVPVADLAVKFGLPETPVGRQTCIVILEVTVEGEPAVMGIVADAVNQVVDLDKNDIEPPPAFGTKLRLEHLQGLGKVGQGFVLLLDVDRVLSTDELAAAIALEAAGGAAGTPDQPSLPGLR